MKIILWSIFLLAVAVVMANSIRIANAQGSPFWDNLLDKYRDDARVRQVIFVQYLGGSDAQVLLYAKGKAPKSDWTLLRSCDGYVGKNGINKEREGDLKTPAGEYDIFSAVGIEANPGTKADYILLDEHIYCADGPYYNRLLDDRDVPLDEIMKYNGDPMNDGSPQFDYGLFIAYNKERKPGKGSQIYLHCFGTNPYTMGCVAVSREDMKYILQNVDNNVKICIFPK